MLRFDPVEYLGQQLSLAQKVRGSMIISPSYDDFLRVDLVVQFVHGVVVFHVYCDLLGSLAMEHGKRRLDLDLACVRTRAQQGSNNTLLRICSTEVMVEDSEEGYGMYSNRCRCPSN